MRGKSKTNNYQAVKSVTSATKEKNRRIVAMKVSREDRKSYKKLKNISMVNGIQINKLRLWRGTGVNQPGDKRRESTAERWNNTCKEWELGRVRWRLKTFGLQLIWTSLANSGCQNQSCMFLMAFQFFSLLSPPSFLLPLIPSHINFLSQALLLGEPRF